MEEEIIKVLEEGITEDFAGLSNFAGTTSSNSADTLTLEKLEKFIESFHSEEFKKKQAEMEKRRANAIQLASKAAFLELITFNEYMQVMGSIQMNGFILVKKELYDKLEKARNMGERPSVERLPKSRRISET